MKSVSIKFKTLTLIVGIIIVVTILQLFVSIYETNALTKIQMNHYSKESYKRVDYELKSYIEIVKNMMEEEYEHNPVNAKEVIINQLKNLRYGENGYFWIHTLDSKMLMHPVNQSRMGQDLNEVKDPDGVYIFREMNKIAKEKGMGKVAYKTIKPDDNKKIDKFSYVFLFEPYDWVVGTGAYVDDIEKNILKIKEDSVEKTKRLIIMVTMFSSVVIIISYFLIIFAFNHVIEKPLVMFKSYFENFLKFITMENNRYTSTEVKNVDEISELLLMINETAESFDKKLKNDMRVMGEVVLTADRIEQGIYNCRIKSDSENPMIMTLKKSLNKMLVVLNTNMQDIQNTLEAYEKDDFTKRIDIDPRLKATMLAVIDGVNTLGETLSENAKSNLHNGETLENNSTTMTSSMENLALKANEQAASLEETAAAVEEITSITRGNTQNATKMATLGKTVRDSVTTGEDLASKTASSMDEINEKVTAINEAINVIDQIAFQTNILSLNAAVEAATAGEAGKGFAVVAQEVRNLASRSAQAAKEIKELVEDANLKANEGKVISDSMIEGYKELNTHISETIHIIEDVSVASREQMTGIEQINDTITMLDRVTQENASEANQVKEIAKEVSAMANELVQDAKSKKFN
ncbi:methyl-accepting chemotaxis protein [Halarcobacter sp.]|uniref:methyl-accepting chemotaxis protein n=1 Tax=Halarcobacter sp. TaxID=2321133 RepID=UPI0029F56297|nr:methyl-accepting chemotaxis protein [Halarcobacter sp.]